MQAFIVRPFGTKSEIDFESVHRQLIQPALDEAEIAGGTTGTIVEAGDIREDMFQLLLMADLVIADTSIHNANVFYELGIRHALRGRQTFLIRAIQSQDVPFDIKTDRYLQYDATNPAASIPELVRGLLETKASNRIDSPVFRLLPRLEEQDQSKLSPVPPAFADDVELACGNRQGGKLGLLSREAGRFVWELGGRRLVGRCQFDREFNVSARVTWELVRKVYPFDLEANLLLGTIHQRLGELTASDQCVRNVLDNQQAGVADRAEALALRARNAKARGRAQFLGKNAAERRSSAISSGFFLESRDLYALAYELDLNHFYSGLNALSLSLLMLGLIEQERDRWTGMFDSSDEASQKESALKAGVNQLTGAVGLALRAAEKRTSERDRIWIEISKADYAFLTAARDLTAANAYQRALAPAKPFHVSAARDQLELFASLNVRKERVDACLERFPVVAPAEQPVLRQAILFTGHMIDAEGREAARFPASSEGAARQAIYNQVRQCINALNGPALGIAGGANGGDILFHEVCHELRIPTRILLTLPEGPFIAESVAHGGEEWIKRFDALMHSHDGANAVQVLGSTKDLPGWMRTQTDYDVWQRTNIWLLEEALASGAPNLTLIALWDGQGGDGPGGTKDLIDQARKHGVTVERIDTNDLFAPASR